MVNSGATLVWLGLGALAGMARANEAPPAPASPTNAQEDALIHQGVELRRAHDDLAARAEFQKAYDLTHSPRAAAQIGLAEFAVGRFDDAEAHLREALRAGRDPWIGKYRKELDKSLAEVQLHVARVEVIGEPAGADVYVNGRLSGHLPLMAPVSVNEGQVDVELRAPGYGRGNRTVTVAGQQYQRLVIRLERERPAASALGGGTTGATTASTAPTPAVARVGAAGQAVAAEGDNRASRDAGLVVSDGGRGTGASIGRRVAKWAALGLAVGALGGGVVAAVTASNNNTKFEQMGCLDMNGKAVNPAGSAVLACQPYLDSFKTARAWEIAGFVGAGVFAATWAVLTLTEPPADRGAAAGGVATRSTWACAPTSFQTLGGTCAVRF